MNVNAQETATDKAADGIEPIRTPEAYLATIDRAFALISETLTAQREGRDIDAGALIRNTTALTDAIKASPFETRGKEVVAKGFTPRIVR